MSEIWAHKEYLIIFTIIAVIYFILRWIHVSRLKMFILESDSPFKATPENNINSTENYNPSASKTKASLICPDTSFNTDPGYIDRKDLSNIEDYSPVIADALISSTPSIIALNSIDWDVFDAIRHSSSSKLDLSGWSNLKDYLDEHYFDVGEPTGFLNRLIGYVGEVKAHDFLDAPLADLPNQPGFDMHMNGVPINSKTGSIQTIREHLEKYPDIPVVTGPEQAGAFEDNEMVFGIPVLDKDTLTEATESTLDLTEDDFDAGGPTIPTVTTIVSGYRELKLLIKGHTDINSALKNAGLDIAGTSLGGWAGAKAGAAIGSPAGPAGIVIGGLVGGISGVILGRKISNAMKNKPFKLAVDNYNQVVSQAESSIKSKELQINQKLSKKVKSELSRHQRAFDKLNIVINQDIHKLNEWSKERCSRFINAFIDLIPEIVSSWKDIQLQEVLKIERSPFYTRLIWPSSNDIKYCFVNSFFKRKKKKIRALSKSISKRSHILTEVEIVKIIKDFMADNPLDHESLKKICLKLNKYTQVTKNKHEEVLRTAKVVADRININGQLEIQKATHESYNEIGELVVRMKDKVEHAKDILIKESLKIGIDIS